MNILVTGGAGYIGAHCCKELAARGFHPVVFDSLVKGHRENVRWGEFYQGSTGNAGELVDCLTRFRFDAVRHFVSGGERRRLEITRALATSPLFMLLDEPFAGIDPIAVADIQQIIRRLKEKEIGILITDHNVQETLFHHGSGLHDQ